MPNQPNTPAVESAIQAKCQGLQVGGTTFFAAANVVVGKFKDISTHTPACEITLTDDLAKRYSESGGQLQGGKIDDSELYMIELTLNMDDELAAEAQLALIRDALSQTFMASAQLATPGVQYSGWEGNGQAGYAVRNGQTFRVYRRKLRVRYEYSAVVTP